VTGLLNFMTTTEMANHSLDAQNLKSMYVSNDIEFVKFLPINENNLENKEATKQLYHAVEYLNDMIINKDLTVFVHSSSGLARASTVVMLYLRLYHSPNLDDQQILNLLA
jgi:protein tyrosine/serine phosphatase